MQSVNVFRTMRTQWRVGFSGPYGLDYGTLPAVLRLLGVPRAKWSEVLADLRTMEAEALAAMHPAQ